MLRGVATPPARLRTPLTPDMLRLLSAIAAAAALTATAPAQTPAAAEQAPPLPQANSAEARALVSACLDKLVAYGRGRFATTEAQDQAMLRNAGLPFGPEDTEVDGGWHRELVWGDADGREYVRANGRMLAKISGDWRLRRDKLSGGLPAPFTLDPSYLLATLGQLPQRILQEAVARNLTPATPLDGVVAQRVPPVSEAPVEAERVRPPPLARLDADVRRGQGAGQEALRRPREVARVQSLRGRFGAQHTIKGHARELVVPPQIARGVDAPAAPAVRRDATPRQVYAARRKGGQIS